ncbi:MAG: hypothetical protein ACE5HO_20125 [bacterium]
MAAFKPLPNPYIVGNPIKTRKMFYGRNDDFEFIKRKLEKGTKSFVIVFCGERRSGKTSILFQILNGELGKNFLPILVDMQTMAGLRNDGEFFDKLVRETLKSQPECKLDIGNYDFFSSQASPYKVFDKFLEDFSAAFSSKNVLFLIDEYELIESKISEASLSSHFITFLAGVLESERKISFIFTGSRRLDQRDNKFWHILFGKSIYRKVSFLSERDTMRLITEPVKSCVTYDKNVLADIYRLTSGQPFYTQVVCQNILDHLNEQQKTHVDSEDLESIMDEILENPLPQMIYFWNSLPHNKMLILSLLAEILEGQDAYVQPNDVRKASRQREFGIQVDIKTISTTLENLFHDQIVKKTDSGYCFQIDLLRRWIKRDHSIWRVLKEIGPALGEEEKPMTDQVTLTSRTADMGKKGVWAGRAVTLSLVAVIAMAMIWFFALKETQTEISPRPEGQRANIENDKQKPLETDLLAVANTEQQAMKAAEDRAALSDAPNHASVEYESAELLKQQAESEFQNQNYATAVELFKGAKRRFEQAAAVAQTRKSEAAAAKAKPKPPPDRAQKGTTPPKKDTRRVNEQAQSHAIAAMKEMTDARLEAQTASANRLAQETFAAAEQKEREARPLFTQKRFEQANAAFLKAQQLYAAAAAEARSVAEKYISEARTLQSNLRSIKSKLNREYTFLEEYQQAVEAENHGQAQMNRQQYADAVGSFRQAIQLFESAATRRQNQIRQIKEAVKIYELALEKKNLKNQQILESQFRKKNHEQWADFFKVAKNLRVDTSIESISFEEHKARALVGVHFIYSGAGGSDGLNKWEIELIETDAGWLITNVKDTR